MKKLALKLLLLVSVTLIVGLILIISPDYDSYKKLGPIFKESHSKSTSNRSIPYSGVTFELKILEKHLKIAELNWKRDLQRKYNELLKIKYSRKISGTIWDFTNPSFSCPFPMERFGRFGDGGKWLCGFQEFFMNKTKCIVYSFGVSSDTSFEQELIERSRNCTVRMFDHTIEIVPKIVKSWPKRAIWYPIGIGSKEQSVRGKRQTTLKTLMEENNDDFIDILKIDVEGSEWESITKILEDFPNKLPFSELLVEIHLPAKQWSEADDRKRIQYILNFWKKLENAGLRQFQQELNFGSIGYSFSEFSFLNINVWPFKINSSEFQVTKESI